MLRIHPPCSWRRIDDAVHPETQVSEQAQFAQAETARASQQSQIAQAESVRANRHAQIAQAETEKAKQNLLGAHRNLYVADMNRALDLAAHPIGNSLKVVIHP